MQKSHAHAMLKSLKSLQCSSFFSLSPQQVPTPCLPVIYWGMLKKSCWLPDCALGAGRGWRVQNTSHWCCMSMPFLPHGTCVIPTVFVLGMHKCIPFHVSCGTDTNRFKIYIHDPSFSVSASSVSSLCVPLKALCSCITLPAAIVPVSPCG